MNVCEKAFDGIVTLAIVKQQKLAVAGSTIAASVCKEGKSGEKQSPKRSKISRANASLVKFVDDLWRIA